MNFEKFNVIKLSNGKKIIVLEKLEYKKNVYLYVDDVNDDETDTLDNYYIMRVNANGTLVLETEKEVLNEIIPLFNRLVKDSYN